MPPTSEPNATSGTHTGAWRRNGVLWGVLILLVSQVVFTLGSYKVLTPFLLLLLVSGVGMLINVVLYFWQLFTGNGRRALDYGLGAMLLDLVFLGLYTMLANAHIGKIGG